MMPSKENIPASKPSKFYIWLLVAFLIIEYARPAFIAELKIQLVMILIFALTVLTKTQYLRSGLIVAQAIFWVLIIKSMPYAVNTFHVYGETRVMFGTIATAAAIAWITQEFAYAKIFLKSWVYVLSYCAIYGVISGGLGPGGFIGDENDLALACSIGLSFTIFGVIFKSGTARIINLLLACIFISGIVVSNSRGGFLAALAVIGYAIFVSRGLIRKIMLPVIAIFLFLGFAPEKYKSEVLSIVVDVQATEDQYSTALQRKYLWATATNMFVEHPLLGVGAGNFPWNVDEYQPKSGNWPSGLMERGQSGSAVHSSYFQLISELALPGVIVFLYMLTKAHFHLRDLRRWSRDGVQPSDREDLAMLSFGLTGALLGYLVGGVFLSTLYYPHFWYLTAMIVGLERYSHRSVMMNQSARTEDEN